MNTYFKRMIEKRKAMYYQIYRIHLLNGDVIEIAEDYDLPVKKGLAGDFERMEEGDILTVEDALMGCTYIPRRSILYISTGGVRKGDAPIADPARKNARKK